MRSDLLSVQEAAEIVGVSTSTFKRMCDSVSIQLIRTPGGHRRIDRMDLDRVASSYFSRRQSKNAETTIAVELGADEILLRLLDGAAFEIAKHFSRWLAEPQRLITALEDSFIAALWKLGEMWRDNVLDIYQERICSNTACTAIDLLRQHVNSRVDCRCIAVGGSMGHCYETIPSKLVSLSLELLGVKAVDLGGAVPAEALARASRDLHASFIWVTHTHVTDVESLLLNHHTLKENLLDGTKIFVGGGGLSPGIRRSLPWCDFFETISQMAQSDVLNRILNQTPVTQ